MLLVHAHQAACMHRYLPLHPPCPAHTHPCVPMVGVGTGVPASPVCLQHHCGQVRREFPAAKLQLADLRDSLPNDCWAKLMVHQHSASGFSCWLPGMTEEGPTPASPAPMQPPSPCSLPRIARSAFTCLAVPSTWSTAHLSYPSLELS